MSYSVPASIPTVFNAGDSFRVTLDEISDYPQASGWSTVLALRCNGKAPIDLTSFSSGSGYAFDVPAGTTSTWSQGKYGWVTRSVLAGEKHTLATGFMQINADPTTVDATDDVRSHARKMLDLIEAALSGRITSDMEVYQIAGRSITKIPVPELYKLRAQYREEISREEAKATGRPQRKIVYSFDRM